MSHIYLIPRSQTYHSHTLHGTAINADQARGGGLGGQWTGSPMAVPVAVPEPDPSISWTSSGASFGPTGSNRLHSGIACSVRR